MGKVDHAGVSQGQGRLFRGKIGKVFHAGVCQGSGRACRGQSRDMVDHVGVCQETKYIMQGSVKGQNKSCRG